MMSMTVNDGTNSGVKEEQPKVAVIEAATAAKKEAEAAKIGLKGIID